MYFYLHRGRDVARSRFPRLCPNQSQNEDETWARRRRRRGVDSPHSDEEMERVR